MCICMCWDPSGGGTALHGTTGPRATDDLLRIHCGARGMQVQMELYTDESAACLYLSTHNPIPSTLHDKHGRGPPGTCMGTGTSSKTYAMLQMSRPSQHESSDPVSSVTSALARRLHASHAQGRKFDPVNPVGTVPRDCMRCIDYPSWSSALPDLWRGARHPSGGPHGCRRPCFRAKKDDVLAVVFEGLHEMLWLLTPLDHRCFPTRLQGLQTDIPSGGPSCAGVFQPDWRGECRQSE